MYTAISAESSLVWTRAGCTGARRARRCEWYHICLAVAALSMPVPGRMLAILETQPAKHWEALSPVPVSKLKHGGQLIT